MDDQEPYFSYTPHKDTPSRSFPESEMSISSDSDVSDSLPPPVNITLTSNDESRCFVTRYSKERLDPELSRVFENIVKGLQGKCKFYPDAVYSELKKNHPTIISSIEKLGYEDCFVLVGRTLVSTLNITNNLIVVPKAIICDVCIVSNDNPVIVLSFYENLRDNEKCDRYNTFLAREVADLLRTFMDDSVSVVSGPVVKGRDLKHQMEQLIKSSDSFFSITPRTIVVSQVDGTHRSAMISLFLGITHAKTYPFLLNGTSGEEKVWTLTAQELEQLMDIIDDITALDYDISCEDTSLLMLETACRKSRRRPVLLDLTEDQYDKMDIKSLSLWYPNLVLTTNARHTGDGHIQGKLRRHRTQQIQKEMTLTRSSYEGKKYVVMKPRKRKRRLKSKTKENALKTTSFDGANGNTEDAELNTGHSESREYRKVMVDLIQLVGYLSASLFFLFRYQEEIPASWPFCVAKCAPLLYLISCVSTHFMQTFEYRCGVLLLGLLFSFTGDAVLVWKEQYLNFGIVAFAFAHLAYAFAFGWQPLNWEGGVLVGFITFVVFSYFTSQLTGTICHVLLFYTISITLMGWRVLTRADKPTKLGIVSTVGFMICNIAIGVDIFVRPFWISHLISMVSYYVAQLGITLSILNSTNGFAKNSTEKERSYTKTFVFVANTVLLFYVLFGIHFLSKMYAMKEFVYDLAQFYSAVWIQTN